MATADPARPEVPLFQGLVHTQITGDRSAATEALKAAHALSPNDPTRSYLLAGHRIEIDQREAGRELLRQGWKDVGTVFIVALILDSIYQVIVHSGIYTLELLITATILAIVPYAMIRGLVTRLARRKQP